MLHHPAVGKGFVDRKTLGTMAMATRKLEHPKKCKAHVLTFSFVVCFAKSLGLGKHGWREGRKEGREGRRGVEGCVLSLLVTGGYIFIYFIFFVFMHFWNLGHILFIAAKKTF